MYSFRNHPTRILRFTTKKGAPRIVAGVLSGTSADGIAAVLVEIRESAKVLKVRELAFVNRPYPPGMREEILANSLPGTGSVDVLCRLNAAIGLRFAEAIRSVARKARISHKRIDLIGSHGQTVHHIPSQQTVHGVTTRSTLQIGDPSIIAVELGVPVVGDFRTADMAAGGQGAPLVPFLDYLIFRSSREARLLLNLGGIANITVLPRNAREKDVRGFDTGPANMILDALAVRFLGKPFDRAGAAARSGAIDTTLLRWMMAHPYLSLQPPKSTGREMFGRSYIDRMLIAFPSIQANDLLATATEFTALSVYDQYVQFVRRTAPVDIVYASGGGSHNRYLMDRLRSHFGTIPVQQTPDVGFSADAKEAVLFAVLAWHTMLGRASNLPLVTGADRSVILGKICVP